MTTQPDPNPPTATIVPHGLLGPDDPDPVGVFNPHGASAFLLIGDHAGIAIPRALGKLGVSDADLQRHIARDIGVLDMGQALAQRLDAAFVHQHYSRLVIDCNRDPARADAIPPVSDGTRIPANESLDPAARAARIAAIHTPYQTAIAAALAGKQALVSLHSFTPAMGGVARPWQVGILHDLGNTAFSHAVLAVLRGEGDLTVGDNQPYRMDGIDHTVPFHANPVGLPYVEIEVRQDLIADAAGQAKWAERLARVLAAAWETLR